MAFQGSPFAGRPIKIEKGSRGGFQGPLELEWHPFTVSFNSGNPWDGLPIVALNSPAHCASNLQTGTVDRMLASQHFCTHNMPLPLFYLHLSMPCHMPLPLLTMHSHAMQ